LNGQEKCDAPEHDLLGNGFHPDRGKEAGTCRSPDYATAANGVDILVEVRVGSIEIR